VSRTDILQTDNDVQVTMSDVQIAESDDQHIEDTINSTYASWKETPMDSCNLGSYLKSKNTAELTRAMKLQLQSDGYNSNPKATFKNNNLEIDPNVSI